MGEHAAHCSRAPERGSGNYRLGEYGSEGRGPGDRGSGGVAPRTTSGSGYEQVVQFGREEQGGVEIHADEVAGEFQREDAVQITSTVQQIKHHSCIRWTGPAIGEGLHIDGVHVWNFTKVKGGVRVSTEETHTGPQVEADTGTGKGRAARAGWARATGGSRGRA